MQCASIYPRCDADGIQCDIRFSELDAILQCASALCTSASNATPLCASRSRRWSTTPSAMLWHPVADGVPQRIEHIFRRVAGSGSALLQAEKASPCPTSNRHVPFGPATRYVPAYWASISFPVVEEPRSALGPSRAGHRGDRTVSGNVLPGNGCAWHGQASELWALCAGGNRITRTCRFPDPQQRSVRFPEDTRSSCGGRLWC